MVVVSRLSTAADVDVSILPHVRLATMSASLLKAYSLPLFHVFCVCLSSPYVGSPY